MNYWCHWTVVLEKTLAIPLDCKEIQSLHPKGNQSWIFIKRTDAEELIHCLIPWCWERLKVGGEGDDRGWDGWMASLTWWTWVWVTSESYWWTGRPGMLQSLGSQRVRYECSIWDLSSLIRDEPMPLALAAGVLTTGPPGKSLLLVFVAAVDGGKR